MSTPSLRYTWKPGCRIRVPAQVVGARLELLRRRHGGMIRPHDLLEDARRPSSPLHRLFEWDDRRAAHQWRLEQAEHILRSLVAVIVTGKRPRLYRAYVAVPPPERSPSAPPRAAYVRIEDALRSPAQRRYLLQQALDEIEWWERKYRALRELASVFAALRNARRALEARATG